MLNSSLLAWISGPGKIKDPKSWLEINLDPNHQISLHFIKNATIWSLVIIMTRSNFREKNQGNKMKLLEILLIFYAIVFFFRLCSKLIFVSFGFSFVIKAWVLQALLIIDRSFLKSHSKT